MFLFLGWAVGSVLIGFMLKKGMSGRKLVLNLGVIAITSIITLIYLPTNKASVLCSNAYFLVLALARKFLCGMIFNARFNQVENTGVAIALTNMIVIGFGSLGQIIMGKLIVSINNGANNIASIHSFISLLFSIASSNFDWHMLGGMVFLINHQNFKLTQ